MTDAIVTRRPPTDHHQNHDGTIARTRAKTQPCSSQELSGRSAETKGWRDPRAQDHSFLGWFVCSACMSCYVSADVETKVPTLLCSVGPFIFRLLFFVGHSPPLQGPRVPYPVLGILFNAACFPSRPFASCRFACLTRSLALRVCFALPSSLFLVPSPLSFTLFSLGFFPDLLGWLAGWQASTRADGDSSLAGGLVLF